MRSSRTHKHLLGVIGAAVIAASTGAASAQQKPMALDRFDPAPAGDRMFGVQSPYVAGNFTPHVMLLGDYAHNPLVLKYDASGQSVGSVVSNQLFLHLNGGLALFNRILVNVDIPVAVVQDGSSPTAGGSAFTSPSSVQLGDLRVGLRLRLFGEYHDAFQIALGGYVWVPTGAHDNGSFVSNGQVRGLPQAIIGGRVAERFVYTAAAGPEIRAAERIASVETGNMLKWGAGVGVLLLDSRHLQLGVEASGAVSLQASQEHNLNAELLGGIRYRIIDDLEIGVGAGPGLTSGVGTPDARGVAMIAYTPEQKRDRDGDGIPDVNDACPDVRGVADPDPRKNGCPSDRDNDGIIDVDDACPDVKGVANSDPKKNGCPRDRDGDGIFDTDDACPDVKGVPNADPKKNGCPPPVDTDGDGIMDDEDACPNEKGVRDPDPQKNGCPKQVRVSEKEILILEQVQFDTAKATIKKVSDPLLDEVAGVLKDHPEIVKIEVQGHTDTRGLAYTNKLLSQARADAVMKALIWRSIDKRRLSAKGYGQDVPISSNDTEEGRQKNRRVQFTILARKVKGEATSAPPPPAKAPKPKAKPKK